MHQPSAFSDLGVFSAMDPQVPCMHTSLQCGIIQWLQKHQLNSNLDVFAFVFRSKILTFGICISLSNVLFK